MGLVNASFEKLLSYEERSFAFEPGQAGGQHSSGEWSGVIFRMGDSRLACSVDIVSEFLPLPQYTPVPGTKSWILGLANVRGDLLTIVDLAWYLKGQRTPITMRSRLLAATLRGRPIGLLVDEVFGQRQFVSNDGKPSDLSDDSPIKEYVQHQYRSGSDVWQELDIEKLFGHAEFLNGAAA
jgi:twitching motility protein PilI